MTLDEYKPEYIRIAEHAKKGELVSYSGYNAPLDNDVRISEKTVQAVLKAKERVLGTNCMGARRNTYKLKLGDLSIIGFHNAFMPSVQDGISSNSDLKNALYIEATVTFPNGNKPIILHSIFPTESFLKECIVSLTNDGRIDLVVALSTMSERLNAIRHKLESSEEKSVDISSIFLKMSMSLIKGRLVKEEGVDKRAKTLTDFSKDYRNNLNGNPQLDFNKEVHTTDTDILNFNGNVIIPKGEPFVFAAIQDRLADVSGFAKRADGVVNMPDNILVIGLKTKKLSLRQISTLRKDGLMSEEDINATLKNGEILVCAINEYLNAHYSPTDDIALDLGQIHDMEYFLNGKSVLHKKEDWFFGKNKDFKVFNFFKFFDNLTVKSKKAFEDSVRCISEYKYGIPISYKKENNFGTIDYGDGDYGIIRTATSGIYPVRSRIQGWEQANYVFFDKVSHPSCVIGKRMLDLIEKKCDGDF